MSKILTQQKSLLTVFSSSRRSGYSPEALVYLEQLTPPPPKDIKDQIAIFIDGLVEDHLYEKIDEMWLFAINTSENAVKGMKALKSATLVNTVNFEAYRGFTQNASTDYINSNFSPTNDGVQCSRYSAHYGIYSRTDNLANASDLGVVDASPNADIWLQMRTSTNASNFKVHCKNNNQLSSIGNSLGFCITTNVDDAQNHLAKNNSGYIHSVIRTTTGFPDDNIFFCRHNGSVAGTLRQYSFATIGGGLSSAECISYYTRLQTLLTYLGANV